MSVLHTKYCHVSFSINTLSHWGFIKLFAFVALCGQLIQIAIISAMAKTGGGELFLLIKFKHVTEWPKAAACVAWGIAALRLLCKCGQKFTKVGANIKEQVSWWSILTRRCAQNQKSPKRKKKKCITYISSQRCRLLRAFAVNTAFRTENLKEICLTRHRGNVI